VRLEHSVSFADEATVHPTAVGHVPDPAHPDRLVVTPQWGLHRAFGPMGSAVVCTAGDVLRCTRLHLDGAWPPTGPACWTPGALVDDFVLGQA